LKEEVSVETTLSVSDYIKEISTIFNKEKFQFKFTLQILKEEVSVETTEKTETLLYNAYLLAGVIGFGAAIILGLVSLPSVSKSLSWQEFRLIQVNVC
jgi:hypothetical protein